MLLRACVFTLFSFVISSVFGAVATVLYDCTEADGSRLLTNVPQNPKACRAISVPVAPPPASAAPNTSVVPTGKGNAKAPPAPSPANFPRIDRETQQSRDSQRRRILEQELGSEQKLLDQAKRDLSSQEAVRLGSERNYQNVLDRLEPYQKKVKQHEDNIANLRKEIANLR